MQTLDADPAPPQPLPSGDLPPGLPDGCQRQQIAYVTGESSLGATLLEFSEPFRCRAVLVNEAKEDAQPVADKSAPQLTLLLIPSDDVDCQDLVAAAWDWVEPGVATERRLGVFITLHGARVVWAPGRAALIAPTDRLANLSLAVLEFAFHEGEVRQIEQAIAAAWPELAADGASAFHFDDRAAQQRGRLAQRYQQVLDLRMRLVRIHPVLHRPPMHPPTLAGQLADRLKERTRLTERIEFIGGQLEVFERVYDACGQRSSEFLLSRKETTLEWVIITLLAVETIVLLVDLLSSLGP